MEDDLILSEEHREKLDGIVGQMTTNGESDEDIQFVVNDFKSKYGTEGEKPDVPKGGTAGESGGLVSPSAQEASSSESDKPKFDISKLNNILYPDKDYQGMSGFVQEQKRKLSESAMQEDKLFQAEMSRLKASGDSKGAEEMERRYVDEHARKNNQDPESGAKIAALKEAGWEEMDLGEPVDHLADKFKKMSSRSNYKYLDNLGELSGTRITDDGERDISSKAIKETYGDLDKYGINTEDFNGFVEGSNTKIKKLHGAGFFTTDTTDFLLDSTDEKIVREIQKNNTLANYTSDRLSHLKGKYFGLVKAGDKEGASKVKAELNKTIEGYQKYVSEQLPNYKKVLDDKNESEYKEYLRENNIGGFKKALNTTGKSIVGFGEGIQGASGDTAAFLADIVGADDTAEYQRMINDTNALLNPNSLDYTIASGKRVTYKGKNYLVTGKDRIIDLDVGKDITAISSKLRIDTDEIKRLGKESVIEDSSYSTSGIITKGSEVLGNLAFQIAATKGTGSALGVTSKTGMLINSMAVQSGMVTSSVYEETLKQLRNAGIDDDKAKGESLDLAMKMGAITAITSMVSPNTSALGLTTNSVDKKLATKLANAYVNGGKENFKNVLWTNVKEKGLNFTREGFEETLQELTESFSQNALNAQVNENIGKDVLNTSMSRDEVIETFILSHSTAGLMALNGKTSAEVKSKLELLEFFSTDLDQANKFIGSMKEDGAITSENADKMLKDINSYARYSNKIPANVSLDKVDPLMGILGKRGDLEIRKKNEDKAFHKEINDKIAILDEEVSALLSGKKVKPEGIETKDALAKTLKEGNWSMLTGENPNAKQASPEENKARNKKAKAWLEDKGYKPQDIVGTYNKNSENSFLVPDLSIEDAQQFAIEFEQESVATSMGIVYQDGSYYPRTEGDSVGGKYDDNYTTLNTPNGKIDFKVNYDFSNKIEGKNQDRRLDEHGLPKELEDTGKGLDKKSNKDETTQQTESTEKKQEGTEASTANITEEVAQESSQKEHSVKTVNNAAKDFFMESDKVVATRDLKSKVDSLVKRGKLTQSQAKRLIKRATAVDPTNTKQVENFLKYFEKQAGISEKRDSKAKIKSAKKAVKKKARQASKRTPANLKDLARNAGNIDERFLNDSDATRYGEILEEVSNGFRSSDNKNYQMPKVDKLNKELEALQEKSDKGREAEYTKKLGGSFEALKAELWKSSEEFEALVSSMAASKATKLKEGLSNLASEVQGKLLKADTSDMSIKEKKILSLLKNTPFDSLTTTQLRDFIKISDNIAVNGNFSNSTKLVKAIEADAKSKKIIKDNEKSGINPRAINTSAEAARVFSFKGAGDFVKTFINSMTSLNVMLDWIGGSSKRGAKLYNELGFFDLSNSSVRATTRKQRFSDLYNKQLNKLSKTYKGILEGDQVVRRSILATLLQADPNSPESMKFFKEGYIQKSIDSLKGYKVNNTQSKQKIEILESILEELSGISTKEDLVAYLKTNDKGNYKMLKFTSDYFLRHTKEFQENSNLAHGEVFEARTEEDFYIPLMRSSLTDKSMRGQIEDIRNDFNKTGNMISFRSGSSTTRKKRAKLQENQTISFDFDTSVMNKYGEQIYDIEASESIINIKSILSNKNLVEHLGLGTAVELQKRALDKIAMDSGSVFQSAQEWEKKLGKVEQTLRKVGSIMALGGVDQFFKQYPAVVFSAGVRLGSDAGLLGKYMFTSKSNIELLKNSSIRLRAEADAGIKRASDDTKYESLSLGEKSKVKMMAKMLVKQGGLTLDKARELSMLSLRVGDVQAAQATFLAYYHSFLRGKGVKDADIDMNTEHVKLKEGEKHRKEAQAYAQHMINTTQTSSDLTEGSKFVANPNVLTRFVMGAIMPFSSHSNNAVIRLLKATSNLSAGKDKVSNGQEIAASMSEIIAFHSIKAFALAPAVAFLGKAIFGGEEDDEELINWAFQTTKAVSSIAGDALPLPDSFEIDLMNYLTYMRTKDQFDEDLDFKGFMREMKNIQLGKSKSYDPSDAPFLFYRYGDKAEFEFLAFDDFGLYDIPIEQAQKVSEAIDLLYDSELTKEGKFGNEMKYELDEEHENFLMVYSLSQLLAMIGTGDATSRRIMEKQYKEILAQSKQ